jgi:hypothetical protein
MVSFEMTIGVVPSMWISGPFRSNFEIVLCPASLRVWGVYLEHWSFAL